jgi:inositol transport system substrate-binding protein
MKMKPSRFIFIYVLIQVIAMSILTSSCSKKTEKKVVRVGITISNFEDKFISYILAQMKEHEKSFDGRIDVFYLDALEDTQKQKEQVNYFIEQGMDAVIVLPVDTGATSEITKLLTRADIPGIYMSKFPDELRDEQPAGIYYIGSDETTSGVMQMEYLAKLLNGKGDVAILMGDLGDNAAFMRTEGVEKVAEKYPNINIVEKESGKWITPLAESIVEEWILSGKKFDAIASNNDEMAIGAIRALEKYQKLDEVVVAGVDATREAINEIKVGKLEATVFQDSKKLGQGALNIAFKVANREAVPKQTWIPFKLVTSENYNEYIQ